MTQISDYLTWSSVITIIISYMAGAMTKLGYCHFKGRKVYVPFIERSGRNFTLMAIALALMSTYTVISTTIASNASIACETQVQTALAYNADVTKMDRPLQDQLADFDAQDRAALRKTLQDITVAQTPEQSLATLQEFLKTTNEIELQRVGVNDQRRQLNDTRQPYPEPHCGQD